MNVSLKLLLFREHHKWTLEDVARQLLLSTDDYLKFEKGKAKINGIIAQKLADLYRAPIELFIIDDTPHYYQAEVMYTNCTFSGNGSNGYINHQYNDRGIDEVIAAKNSEIKTLQQQVETLQQHNNKLVEILEKRFFSA